MNLIQLNLGCGNVRRMSTIGVDRRQTPIVDVIHDLETFPYPFPDGVCEYAYATYILEHLKPWLQFRIMDEIWRIMMVGGVLDIAVPYAGSPADYSSPDHCTHFNEQTFLVFDPAYTIYTTYHPKPWHILEGFPSYDPKCTMVIMMRKLEEV